MGDDDTSPALPPEGDGRRDGQTDGHLVMKQPRTSVPTAGERPADAAGSAAKSERVATAATHRLDYERYGRPSRRDGLVVQIQRRRGLGRSGALRGSVFLLVIEVRRYLAGATVRITDP